MRSNLALIGPEAATGPGSTREPSGRPGPAGVGAGVTGVFRPHTHPLRSPAGTYGARFAGVGPPLAACWVPGIALPVYPPWYPPGIPTWPVPPVHAVLHVASSAVPTAVLGPV